MVFVLCFVRLFIGHHLTHRVCFRRATAATDIQSGSDNPGARSPPGQPPKPVHGAAVERPERRSPPLTATGRAVPDATDNPHTGADLLRQRPNHLPDHTLPGAAGRHRDDAQHNTSAAAAPAPDGQHHNAERAAATGADSHGGDGGHLGRRPAHAHFHDPDDDHGRRSELDADRAERATVHGHTHHRVAAGPGHQPGQHYSGAQHPNDTHRSKYSR